MPVCVVGKKQNARNLAARILMDALLSGKVVELEGKSAYSADIEMQILALAQQLDNFGSYALVKRMQPDMIIEQDMREDEQG